MTSLSLSFCGKQAVWYCTHGILHGCVTRLQAVQRVGSMYNDPKREAAGENNEERTVDVAWALQKWLKCVRPILGEGCNTGEIKEEEGRKKRVKRKAVSRLFLIPPLQGWFSCLKRRHEHKVNCFTGEDSTSFFFKPHFRKAPFLFLILFLLSCFFQKLEIRFEQVCGFTAQPFIPVYRQAGWEQTAAKVHVRDGWGTERER